MTRWSPARGLARCAIACIELYRNMISPYRPPSCRFIPTCSEYAVDALRGHGLLRGGALAMMRLAKCGPWHRGGWDPIPQPRHHHRLTEACTSTTDGAATLRSDLRV